MKILFWNIGGTNNLDKKLKEALHMTPDLIIFCEVTYDGFVKNDIGKQLRNSGFSSYLSSYEEYIKYNNDESSLLRVKGIVAFGDGLKPSGIAGLNTVPDNHKLKIVSFKQSDINFVVFHSANGREKDVNGKMVYENMYEYLWKELKDCDNLVVIGDFNAVLHYDKPNSSMPFADFAETNDSKYIKFSDHKEEFYSKLMQKDRRFLKAFMQMPPHLNYIIPEGGIKQFSLRSHRSLIDHCIVSDDLLKKVSGVRYVNSVKDHKGLLLEIF
jgi:exonuclease III